MFCFAKMACPKIRTAISSCVTIFSDSQQVREDAYKSRTERLVGNQNCKYNIWHTPFLYDHASAMQKHDTKFG